MAWCTRCACRQHAKVENVNSPSVVPSHTFARLDAKLPASAVYSLGSYEGEPDIWCITQVLLPSLPAGPGARATWTITMGTSPVPPAERGTRPDREVLIYRPGYAIVRSGG